MDEIGAFFRDLVRLEYRSLLQFLSTVWKDLIRRNYVVQEAWGATKWSILKDDCKQHCMSFLPEKAPPLLLRNILPVCMSFTDWQVNSTEVPLAFAGMSLRQRIICNLWGNLALRTDSIVHLERSDFSIAQNNEIIRHFENLNVEKHDILCLVTKDKIRNQENRTIVTKCGCISSELVRQGLAPSKRLNGLLNSAKDLCLIHGKYGIIQINEITKQPERIRDDIFPIKQHEVNAVTKILAVRNHSGRRTMALVVRYLMGELPTVINVSQTTNTEPYRFNKSLVLKRFGWTEDSMLKAYTQGYEQFLPKELVIFWGGIRAMMPATAPFNNTPPMTVNFKTSNSEMYEFTKDEKEAQRKKATAMKKKKEQGVP